MFFIPQVTPTGGKAIAMTDTFRDAQIIIPIEEEVAGKDVADDEIEGNS